MKLEIKIVVTVPEVFGDQHTMFVQRVMDTFRDVFPDVEQLPPGKDYIPPVTVTVHTEEEAGSSST